MEPVHRYHPIGREVAGVVDPSPAHLLLGDELAKSVLGTDAVHERHDPHLGRPGDLGEPAHHRLDRPGLRADERPRQVRHLAQLLQGGETPFYPGVTLGVPPYLQTLAVDLLHPLLDLFHSVDLHASAGEIGAQDRADGAEAHDADDWFAHVSPLRPLQSRHPGPKVSNVKGKMSMTTPPLARGRLLHHALLGP